RRAADSRELGDAVRLDVELPARLDERRRDRVVAAAGAEGRDLAFVVAPGEAELVARQGGVMQLRLGEVAHAARPFLATLAIGSTLSARTRAAIASMMKR